MTIIAQLLSGISTPNGFTRTVTNEAYPGHPGTEHIALILERSDVKITIEFNDDPAYFVASGHVEFDTARGRLSFDRYGVEDSFYISTSSFGRSVDPVVEANETIRRMIEERIPAARETAARQERVPGLPFHLTPERKTQAIEALKTRGTWQWMPSGFGQGYTLSTRRDRYGFSRRATAETAKFFGISPLYVETFDAD